MAVPGEEGLAEDHRGDRQKASIDALPPELLNKVLWHLPRTASMANALCGVCAEWRAAILNEEAYLSVIHFHLDVNQPFRGMGTLRGAVAHRRTWAHRRRGEGDDDSARTALKDDAVAGARVPEILVRAAQTGANVTALETLGALREAQGDHAGAYKAWKRSASLGSSIGQFKLGEIFYRGLGNQGVDGEEALFWLSKAVKNRTAPLAPESMATAAGIMGFLHLDGEGTQACNATAVKWFKVAAEHGNREADKTLGWLYNTGQY